MKFGKQPKRVQQEPEYRDTVVDELYEIPELGEEAIPKYEPFEDEVIFPQGNDYYWYQTSSKTFQCKIDTATHLPVLPEGFYWKREWNPKTEIYSLECWKGNADSRFKARKGKRICGQQVTGIFPSPAWERARAMILIGDARTRVTIFGKEEALKMAFSFVTNPSVKPFPEGKYYPALPRPTITGQRF